MRHGFQRIMERLEGAEQVAIRKAIRELTDLPPDRDWAVCLGRIPFRGPRTGEESNGDRIVAVVRKGCLTTVMLRRSSQPWTPPALKVDGLLSREVVGL